MADFEHIIAAPAITLEVPGAEGREAAFAFYLALRKLGKQVKLPLNLQTGLPESPLHEKNFAVTLRGLGRVISKVYYERDSQDVRLYFTLKNGDISPKDLAIDTSQPPHLTIIVGEKSLSDNEKNIVAGTKELLESILLKLPDSAESIKIASHLLAHSRHSTESKLCISSPTQHLSAKILPSALKEIQELGVPSCLVLFEENGKAKGLLCSGDEALKQSISSSFPSQEKKGWLLFTAPNQRPQEIQERILTQLQ